MLTRAIGSSSRFMQLRKRSTGVTAAANAVLGGTIISASGDSPEPVAGAAETAKPVRKKARVSSAKTSKASAIPIATETTPEGERVVYTYGTLVAGRLIRRYKRFLADVVLLNDPAAKEQQPVEDLTEVVTVYCPNTGPMVSLLDEPNARVQLSKSDDPKRKYAYTMEMIQIHNGERNVWVGVHSTLANRMVERAITARWIPELSSFDRWQREVKFAKNSRVDFVLSREETDEAPAHEHYVEVKSVTLALPSPLPSQEERQRCAVFPDTASPRAQKHVTELTEMIETHAAARSATLCFLVQRDDCHEFAPALLHDAKFAALCQTAFQRGITLIAYSCALEPDEANNTGRVRLLRALPLTAAFIEESDGPQDAADANHE